MTNLLDRTEAEAAALEALQPVDDNTTLLAAIADARKLKAQRDAAAAAYTAAADKLGAYLTEEGLQGLTLHGKVVVRRSLGANGEVGQQEAEGEASANLRGFHLSNRERPAESRLAGKVAHVAQLGERTAGE